MTIISPLPFTLVNGTVADASKVLADLQHIVDQVNANASQIGSGGAISSVTVSGITANGSTITLPDGSIPLFLRISSADATPNGSTVITVQGGSFGQSFTSPDEDHVLLLPFQDITDWINESPLTADITNSDYNGATISVTIYHI